MKITIIGGGNIGTLMAAEFASKGHQVTMYTSRLKDWNKKIEVYNAHDELLLSTSLENVTDSIEVAVKDAEYIWVVIPSQLFSDLVNKMLPYVKKGQKIGIVPGTGGAEYIFHKLIDKGCTLFGLQRVHDIARLKQYGNSVYSLGRKPEIYIGAIPRKDTEEVCKVAENLFDLPCVRLDNYLAVTLTPSNPILHTTRLYALFETYHEGILYPQNIKFYEEWDDFSSEMLIACDTELQGLCDIIPLDLSAVKSLCDHYESHSVKEMTKKISNIQAFKGLLSPMKEVNGGWIPDWNSRYFTADFPYGLKIIKDIAEMFHYSVPNISTVWNWYCEVAMMPDTNIFEMPLNKEEFIKLYK